MGASVASLCGAVLPGKLLKEEEGWGKGGRGAGSLVAPPWLQPGTDPWVGSGGGCYVF